jgi:hypothetical protein
VELIALRGIKREPSTAEKRFATVHCATPLSGSGPLSLRADTLLLRRASSAIAFGSVPLCPCFWSRVNQIYHAGYWKLQAIPKVYTDADQPWSFVTVPETLGRSAIGAIGRHCRRISAMDEVLSHGIAVDGTSLQNIASSIVKLYSKVESPQNPTIASPAHTKPSARGPSTIFPARRLAPWLFSRKSTRTRRASRSEGFSFLRAATR